MELIKGNDKHTHSLGTTPYEVSSKMHYNNEIETNIRI